MEGYLSINKMTENRRRTDVSPGNIPELTPNVIAIFLKGGNHYRIQRNYNVIVVLEYHK